MSKKKSAHTDRDIKTLEYLLINESGNITDFREVGGESSMSYLVEQGFVERYNSPHPRTGLISARYRITEKGRNLLKELSQEKNENSETRPVLDRETEIEMRSLKMR